MRHLLELWLHSEMLLDEASDECEVFLIKPQTEAIEYEHSHSLRKYFMLSNYTFKFAC